MLPPSLTFPGEIDRVQSRINGLLDLDAGLFHEAAGFILEGHGKKLRPRLLLLVLRALGYDSPEIEPRVIDAAACVELVHLASLIHDDVIDKALTRRGRPSVNARFGDDVAILMADYLYAQAFDLALDAAGGPVLRLICQVTRTMCRSEVFQIEKRDDVLSENDYLTIIEAKTATLFAACAEIGGMLAGADAARRRNLAQFALDIGMAYQITDDTLDYTGAGDALGKPVGHDLAQGKQTLPLVHTFSRASEDDRRDLLAHLGNGRKMCHVLPVIQKYGGLEYSARRAREFASAAAERIPQLHLSRDDGSFAALCRFVVERTS